jgi:hypothetical protein
MNHHVSPRSPLSRLLLLAAVAVAAACGDDRPAVPTAPPSLNTQYQVGQVCSDAVAKQVSSGIKTLYKSSRDQQDASRSWKLVTDACLPVSSGRAQLAAQVAAINYIQFFLSAWKGIAPSSGAGLNQPTNYAQLYADHVNYVLFYVFGEARGPSGAGVTRGAFGVEGAIAVCGLFEGKTTVECVPASSAGTNILLTSKKWFALRVNNGFIGPGKTTLDRYLFTVAPVYNSECTSSALWDNFVFHGPCHDFAMNPAESIAGRFLSIASCVFDDEDFYAGVPPTTQLTVKKAFRHAVPASTAGEVTLAPPAAQALSATSCEDSENKVPDNLGTYAALAPNRAGLFAAALRGTGSLASRTFALFGPQNLYAAHAFGSDARSPDGSPVGAIDPRIFLGNWDNVTTFPTTVASGATVNAEIGGTWSAEQVTSPGSITIEQSVLGLSKVAVLNQGGGACPGSCGGLTFTAAINGDRVPDHGLYELAFTGAQLSPTVKRAPLAIKDAEGDVIAILSYISTSSANLLTFSYGDPASTTNGTTELIVGEWVRNVPQNFRVRIDLDADVLSLFIGGQLIIGSADGTTGTKVQTNVPFYNPHASSLKYFVADFMKIDAGRLVLDNLDIYGQPVYLPIATP